MRSDIIRDPLILTLARGHYCPKEHQQHLELAANYPKIADWDLSTPGLREAWAAGDRSPFHGWDRRSAGPAGSLIATARPGPGRCPGTRGRRQPLPALVGDGYREDECGGFRGRVILVSPRNAPVSGRARAAP